MVIRRPRGRAGRDAVPSTTPGLTMVSSMVIFGVTMNEALSFEAHITRLIMLAGQTIAVCLAHPGGAWSFRPYAILRDSCYNGGPNALCCSGLVGVAGQQEKNCLQSAMRRLIRLR